MRPRNTLVLLVVLAALGAYLYWVELPQQAKQAAEKKLVTLDKNGVTALTLDYPDHSITLEKAADGHWRLTKPVEADADEQAVKNLIAAIADAEVTRTLDDVADKLPSYGLDNPEATVRVTVKDGATVPPLKVGKTTSVGFATYVQKEGDPRVFITGGAFQAGMKKQVKDLRDKTIITYEDQDVQRVALERADGTIVLERQEPSRWIVTAPASYPADAAEVRSLLASIRGVRADDFVSDDPAADLGPYGLTTPRLKATVAIGNDRAQKTLLIGGPHEDAQKKMLYAKRAEGSSVYTIPEYSLKNIDKGLATLRDKTVATFEKDKAATVEVARKDGQGFTLAKRDDTWHIDTPGDGVERGPTVSRFVDDLAGMKGSEIVAEGTVDLAQYGLADPDLTITVKDATGGTLATMIGARGAATGADARSYLAPKGGAIVYGVKSFSYDRVDKKAPDFREKLVTPPPAAVGESPRPPIAPGAALDESDVGADDMGGDADDDADSDDE